MDELKQLSDYELVRQAQEKMAEFVEFWQEAEGRFYKSGLRFSVMQATDRPAMWVEAYYRRKVEPPALFGEKNNEETRHGVDSDTVKPRALETIEN